MRRDQLDELSFLRAMGFTHLDLASRVASTAEGANAIAESSLTPPVNIVLPGPDLDAIIAQESLESLAVIAAPCGRCRLATTRTQVVFGSGNPSARLMFIGEAPGRDEDLAGLPFVGRSGQLLTDIIKAMKLEREQVYIANVIKCRPPGNRPPENDELDACRPYIERQIDFIKPEVIVTLGRFALESTLQKTVNISSVRGEWMEFRSTRLMPTFHPAYLLRNPAAKKQVWGDMKKVMLELGID